MANVFSLVESNAVKAIDQSACAFHFAFGTGFLANRENQENRQKWENGVPVGRKPKNNVKITQNREKTGYSLDH